MSSSILFLLIWLLPTQLSPEPLDLNEASVWQLEALPGVGPATAARILEFRETYGPFGSTEELLEVAGIGRRTLEGLEGMISVGALAPDTSHWLPISRPDSLLLEMFFLDVGQGDAVLLLPTGGRPCLVDGGPDEGGPLVPPVIRALAEVGVDTVPVAVLTHPHSDHVGGLAEVVRSCGVRLMLDPMIDHFSPLYESLLEALLKVDADYRPLAPGDSLWLSESVLLRVVCVQGRTAGGSTAEEELSVNDRGAVLLVECGDFTALLTGDIEEPAERLLAPELGPVAVVKVPHHGSASSLFGPFLDRLRPQLAVVCCGARNPFGHPHPSALEAWSAGGAEVLRTDRCGTIVVATDGHALHHHSITGGESGETPR